MSDHLIVQWDNLWCVACIEDADGEICRKLSPWYTSKQEALDKLDLINLHGVDE
jgi:hypothetical protein